MVAEEFGDDTALAWRTMHAWHQQVVATGMGDPNGIGDPNDRANEATQIFEGLCEAGRRRDPNQIVRWLNRAQAHKSKTQTWMEQNGDDDESEGVSASGAGLFPLSDVVAITLAASNLASDSSKGSIVDGSCGAKRHLELLLAKNGIGSSKDTRFVISGLK